MSWTFTMNSDGGSRGLLVSLATAWAVNVYWACSSRSRVFVAWMLPVLSSMTKIVPAPSPDRMYLIFPSPESTSEWSWKNGDKTEFSLNYMHIFQYMWNLKRKRERLAVPHKGRKSGQKANLEDTDSLGCLADARWGCNFPSLQTKVSEWLG